MERRFSQPFLIAALAFAAGLTFAYWTAESSAASHQTVQQESPFGQEVDLELVLAVDVSRSMDLAEQEIGRAHV